jgi:hypothetical protein
VSAENKRQFALLLDWSQSWFLLLDSFRCRYDVPNLLVLVGISYSRGTTFLLVDKPAAELLLSHINYATIGVQLLFAAFRQTTRLKLLICRGATKADKVYSKEEG